MPNSPNTVIQPSNHSFNYFINFLAKKTILFLSWTNFNSGEPVFAITKSKTGQLRNIASSYFYKKQFDDIDCRFDMITILFKPKDKPEIKHYINAF